MAPGGDFEKKQDNSSGMVRIRTQFGVLGIQSLSE